MNIAILLVLGLACAASPPAGPPPAAPVVAPAASPPAEVTAAPAPPPALPPAPPTSGPTTLRGSLAHEASGAWTLTPCSGVATAVSGDPTSALQGLGAGPWQVVIDALPGSPVALVEVAYASPVGDICRTPLPSARGTEPGWALRWTGSKGTFETGAQPPQTVDTWTLGPGPCHDGAAGAYYHRSASVTVRGITYRGCAIVAFPAAQQ